MVAKVFIFQGYCRYLATLLIIITRFAQGTNGVIFLTIKGISWIGSAYSHLALSLQVRTLVNRNQPVGNHSVVWDGKNDLGGSVASGIYFYKLRIAKRFFATRKMLLLK